MPNAARCGGDFRFAPCVAGTCGSPHTPPPFFVIPYSLGSKRTAPATGRGLEPNRAPGFFFAPNLRPRSSRSEPSRIKEGTRKGAFFWFVPPASPRQPFPNPCRRAAHQNYSLFSILSSLVPPRPSPPTSRESQRTALIRRAGDQFPGGNAGLQNALSPRTAPHAGHRLILNPCRRAALRNSSLFSIHSPSPAPFSLRSGQQNKNIFCFFHLTHNSARYNIGLNLIMEGKEYGKTGSA